MRRIARWAMDFPGRMRKWFARRALMRFAACRGSMPFDLAVVRFLYLAKRILQRSIRCGAGVFRRQSLIRLCREFDDQFWLRLDQLTRIQGKDEDQLYATYTANQRIAEVEWQAMRRQAHEWEDAPLVSILTPVFNSEPVWLDRLHRSIEVQAFERWEWILVDDGSTNSETNQALRRLDGQDDRIVVEFAKTNAGVAVATNRAVELASGGLLAFVDHDDELLPDALWQIVAKFRAEPRCDVVYTDEEMVPERRPAYPHFKPDFAPENLAAYNGICHLLVVRRESFEAVGGLRIDTEGAQDYDLVLRLLRHGCRFEHVSRILYRWHLVDRSLSRVRDSRTGYLKQANHVGDLTQRIVQQHFDAIGLPAKADLVGDWINPRCQPVDSGKATIVICTRDQPDLLRRCIDSIEQTTDYPNYELLIVDNDSELESTRQLLFDLAKRHRISRIASGPEGFNFSRLNNAAAKLATGDFLVFLNNDTEVINPGWLSALVGWLQVNGVGAVGAKLLFGNGRIQHAGVIVGAMDWGPWHVLRDLPGDSNAFHGYLQLPHNNAAVTGACLATQRRTFEQIGGFDEVDFGVCFNDIDYCLRIGKAGLRCVYTPQAELFHHESSSRPPVTHPNEAANFKSRYEGLVDPYWNPNYTRESYCFEMRTRRQARHVVGVKSLVVAVVAGPDSPHVPPIVELLTEIAMSTDLKFEISDLKSKISDLKSGNPSLVFVDGAENYAAVHTAALMGLPCIWRINGRLAIDPVWTPAERVAFLQALQIPYQVVFDCRCHRLEAERGWSRVNFSAIDSTLLGGAPFSDRQISECRHELRMQHGLPDEAVLVASCDENSRMSIHANAKLLERKEDGDFDHALAACDMFVAEPLRRARSCVTMQAMRNGMPLVATRAVACADLLQPGVNGLEFREYDPADRDVKIAELTADAALRRRLGDAGRTWLESRRSTNAILDDWAELFVEAVELGLERFPTSRVDCFGVSAKMPATTENFATRRA